MWGIIVWRVFSPSYETPRKYKPNIGAFGYDIKLVLNKKPDVLVLPSSFMYSDLLS